MAGQVAADLLVGRIRGEPTGVADRVVYTPSACQKILSAPQFRRCRRWQCARRRGTAPSTASRAPHGAPARSSPARAPVGRRRAPPRMSSRDRRSACSQASQAAAGTAALTGLEHEHGDVARGALLSGPSKSAYWTFTLRHSSARSSPSATRARTRRRSPRICTSASGFALRLCDQAGCALVAGVGSDHDHALAVGEVEHRCRARLSGAAPVEVRSRTGALNVARRPPRRPRDV